MPRDYIPLDDGRFHGWQDQFGDRLNSNLSSLGLTSGDPDVVALNDARATWEAGFPAHIAAKAAARSACAAKNDARAAYKAVIRRVALRLQASPDASEPEKVLLGLRPRDLTRTPLAVPDSAPWLGLDTSEPLRIRIRVMDAGLPRRRAKPRGALGCEIRYKIGDQTGEIKDWPFLTLCTREFFIAEFEGFQSNQTAHFVGVWVTRRGERGPYSRTASGTITAIG